MLQRSFKNEGNRYLRNRRAVVAAACLAIFTCLLVGCGGSDKAADAYIRKGDQIMAEIDEKAERLSKRMETMFTGLYGQLTSSMKLDRAGFDKDARGIKSLAAQMVEEAGEAKKAYTRVAGLSDVPVHKEYAELGIQIIDDSAASLGQLMAFLDECANRMSAKSFDAFAFQSYVSEFGNWLEVQGDKTGQLQLKADKLKEKF
jgi:hypothetical protein